MDFYLLNNKYIQKLLNHSIEAYLNQTILECSFSYRIPWMTLYKITHEYLYKTDFTKEDRLNYYKHYIRIVSRLKSNDPVFTDKAKKIGQETCFSSIVINQGKEVYNKLAYYLNSPEIELNDDDSDLSDVYTIENTVTNRNGINLLEAMVLLSLSLSLKNSQLSGLNQEPNQSSYSPVEFLSRLIQTVEDPKFMLSFLSVVLDHLESMMKSKINELSLVVPQSTHAQAETISKALEYLKMCEENALNDCSECIDPYNPQNTRLTDYLDYTISLHLTETILPLCKYIIEHYVTTGGLLNDEALLCIKKEELPIIVRDFNRQYPQIALLNTDTKLATGTANIIFMYLYESIKMATTTFMILPEIQEALNKLETYEVLILKQKYQLP